MIRPWIDHELFEVTWGLIAILGGNRVNVDS